MNKRTFTDIYSDWKKVKIFTVKESTFATYVINAEKHIVPYFGAETEVSESMVNDFICMKTAAGLSRNTLRSLLQVLRMIASYGMRQGWLDYNGWSVRLSGGRADRRLLILSVSEQQRLMKFLTQNMSFRNIGIFICLCTGMRIGEICALRWSDIHIDTRCISVCRTIERIYTTDLDEHRTKLVIGMPKSLSSLREIPVNAVLARLLRPFVAISNADNYVLTNSRKPLEPRLYRRHYMLLMQRAGLPRLNFHGLRHTFATRCIESRCDYKTVSSILGHASIATTMNLYVHPDIEQKRRCIEKMMKHIKKE